MISFLLGRLVNYLLLTTIATCAGYFLAASALNPRANYEGRSPKPPEAVIDKTLDDYNLNDKTPVMVRFQRWVGDVIQGDFGSRVTGESVNAEIGRRIGVSLRLLLLGSILGSAVGVLLGVVSAVRQYGPGDHTITFLSFLILSTPVFLLAIVLKFAALNVNELFGTTLFYYTGEATPGLTGGFGRVALDRLQHLIIPTVTIALGGAAFFSRYQRGAMLDVLGGDFIRTARAKGLRRGHALVRHGLRVALIPMTTFFAYTFGLLLIGATFVEKTFSWHGMGELLVDSITRNDVNAVAAVTCFTAVMVLLAGLVADLAHAALDPRIRTR